MNYESLKDLQEKLNTGSRICPTFSNRGAYFDHMCGCGIRDMKPERKRDCFFYHEEHDMGATIPCCGYHGGYGNCPCDGCDKYVGFGTASMVIRAMVERGDFDQNGENGQKGIN